MRKCLVEECDEKHWGKGYCQKHYNQIKYHGQIRERTIYDANDFIIDDIICWIILRNNKCEEVARTKIDTKYYKQIKNSKLKWYLDNYGYPATTWTDKNGQLQRAFLHQLIIQLSGQEVKDDEEIDHKDGNPLNNLDDNLRICTHSQNLQNKRIYNNNKSGKKGVSWNKQAKNWQVYCAGEYQGAFNTIEEAAKAYNTAAINQFGEFAVLNDV